MILKNRYGPQPSLVILATLVVVFYGLDGSQGVRVRLGYSDEPKSQEVYNMHRSLGANPNLYFLKSAGLLNESELSVYLLEEKRGPDGSFSKANFSFNSMEFFYKVLLVQWFAPLEERSCLQVYDNPLDRDLATGPQVNQELCGLHLDYMLHMSRKHLTNFANSTEYSIFTLMNSFGTPGTNIEAANHIWNGNYVRCTSFQLNIMKRELAEVSKHKAEKYFKNRMKFVSESKPSEPMRALTSLLEYLGTLIGIPKDNAFVNLDKHAGEIHALPTRYCMAGLRWPQWPNSTFYRRALNFRTAVCLPETCDSNSLAIHGNKIKKLLDFKTSEYMSGFYIESLYCLPDEKSKLRNPFNYTSTTLFIAFNVVWLSLTLLATVVKIYATKKRKLAKGKSSSSDIPNQERSRWLLYLDSWCLIKNLRDFLAAKRGRMEETAADTTNTNNQCNKVDLDPLEGYKVISSMCVITSHACIVYMGHTWNLSETDRLVARSYLAMIHTVCPSVVDNFFVITGIVMGRVLFKTPAKVLTTAVFWIQFILYRYLRIVPLFLLIHWFLKSTFRFIGSGPFWDYGTSHSAWSKMCSDESYWDVILPSVNFKSPASTCNGTGWYLANDIQFSLITPIFILFYLKKPFLGHLVTLGTAILVAANHIRYYFNLAMDPRGALESSILTLSVVTDDATSGYVNPQYRCVSFLLGLAASRVLVDYELGVIKKWPKWFVRCGKTYLYSTMYLLAFAPYINTLLPYENKPLIKVLAAVFSGTLHGLTSVAAVFFTLFLCTGHLPSLARLYSKPTFRPLANVSLSTLLVHIPLLFYRSQTLTNLAEASFYQFIIMNFIWIVESFLLAIVVHVLYEIPLRRFLMKFIIYLFSGPNNTKSSAPRNATNKSKSN